MVVLLEWMSMRMGAVGKVWCWLGEITKGQDRKGFYRVTVFERLNEGDTAFFNAPQEAVGHLLGLVSPLGRAHDGQGPGETKKTLAYQGSVANIWSVAQR
jgi:hypothetical protein